MISWNRKILRKPITSLICGQYWSRQSQVIQLNSSQPLVLQAHWYITIHANSEITVLNDHSSTTKLQLKLILFLSVWNRLRDDLDTVLMSERAWERHWRRAGAGTGCYWSPPTRLEKLGEETAAACLLPCIRHYAKTTMIQYNEGQNQQSTEWFPRNFDNVSFIVVIGKYFLIDNKKDVLSSNNKI